MFKILKCPSCGAELEADETKNVLTCSCGNRYKNPYYNDMENALVNPTDEKRTILARLFALRASYFYVNEHRDKIKENTGEINSIISDKVSKSEQRIKQLNKSKLGYDDVKVKHVNGVMKELEEERTALYKGKVDGEFVFGILSIIFIVLGIAVIIATTILMWKGKMPYPVWNDDMIRLVEQNDTIDLFLVTLGWGAAFGVGTAVALELIMTIISLINIAVQRANKGIGEASISRRKKKYGDSKKCQKALAPLLIENDERNQGIDAQIEMEQEIIAKQVAIIDEIKSDNAALEDYVNACMELLEEQFNDLIYVSDWDNLDYIIYLFVTMRASNMKEALQLLDEQKRAEQLIKVVQDSTAYLAKNINSALRGLKQDLDREFKKVNDNMSEMEKKLSSSISSSASRTRKYIGDCTAYLAGYVYDCTRY
ncbi:MAG: DUF4064 domain-containing protein [Bacteroides sp.]|nr:DUF4064 domain-containing protein [Bacillota bacterium]MCM1394203.1 DUF4064 domain-containing protein [[Eubacterium] siraeum]MCM1455751.1 DUF4064 domain-containing protein [Bacteroides sp.]